MTSRDRSQPDQSGATAPAPAAGAGIVLKRQLRDQLRRARQSLAPADARECSRAACDRLLSDPRFVGAAGVVLYDAVDGELDVGSVVESVRALGKRLFYPGMTSAGLRFLEDTGGPHRMGRWGIREPDTSTELERGAQNILFVVPGVAFDLNGHRLGRGLGAYDRVFEHHEGYRIGMAYEFQIVPLLPTATWDVPMHVVLTEARRIDARPQLGGMEETA